MSKSKLTLAVAGVVSALSMGVTTQEAEAANWLMLQGTESPGAVGRAKVWGFVQPEVQYTDGEKVAAGPWKGSNFAPNMIAPNLTSRATFQMRRARIGVRGQGFPLDNKVNYFILSEFGNNGITNYSGAALTDASVTLNHVPYARVRVGQFKHPGAEEGLQAIHVFNYTNFTNFTDQQLLERYLDADKGANNTNDAMNGQNGPVGAFRDIGVQLFDTIKKGSWEHSYALMVGNGNGINRSDNNGAKDTYLYWSSEQVYGGKGGRRDGLKLSAWQQKGERTITTSKGVENFDRTRSGLGATFRKGKIRAGAEYFMADGMIFNGTGGNAVPGSISADGTKVSDFQYLPEDKAKGWYADIGYLVTPKIELDLRYDDYDRATETDASHRKLTNLTLGAQYFFNKKTRAVFNYEMRSAEAPDLASTAAPNLIGEKMSDRISVQLLAIF